MSTVTDGYRRRGPDPDQADGVPASYGDIVSVLAMLPVLVREKRRRDRLNLRTAGEQSGVGFNTVSRTERGEHCSLTNAVRLLLWLDDRPVPTGPVLPSAAPSGAGHEAASGSDGP